MNKPKTEILEYNVNWNIIKRACMRTIGKEAGDKEPPKAWKRKLLICRHSPIRKGWITWKWSDIPYAISTHFARHHEGTEKYISTSRADRTEIKDRSQRSQMDPVSMEMDANIEALISISERRLCMCADPTTRAYWQDLKDCIEKYDEDIAWAMIPQCVRCGGCVEPFGECKFYEKLMEGHTLEEQQDIMQRYDIYREYQKELKLKKGGR
jgi:hypothetical protein